MLGSRLLRSGQLSSLAGRRLVSFDASSNHKKASNSPFSKVALVRKRSVDLLNDPLLNKGSGFPTAERDRLGIRGLVPPRVQPLDNGIQIQASRVMKRLSGIKDDLEKYVTFSNLQDRNEVLFYYVLTNHIEELAKIVYTPTVGRACQNFAHIFRRTRGMYFSANDRNNMAAMVYNWPIDDVQCIVVTDGSRILGLGDLGANGMGIPIGKLSLYTVGAGFHPSRCLPVVLDVGTNNRELLDDPLYLGLNQPRLKGPEYYEVLDEFITSVHRRWPKALIQFEDFNNENALTILERYRDKLLCFNDDIQGTGSMALSGVLSALRASGQPQSALVNQRIVVLGAGTAGLGVANSIKYGMQQMGLSAKKASQRFWLLDQKGVLGKGRQANSEAQAAYVRSDIEDGVPLEELIARVKPTILLGLSGVGQTFSERTIREMAKHVDRPIIFPLSNPTDRAECTAEQAFNWTNGRAIFASGSPFEPVQMHGKTYFPNQANNMYTFPGLGLGAIACQARTVTDRMLFTASTTLAATLSDDLLKQGRIFPPLRTIRDVSQMIAVAICKTARDEGVATLPVPQSDEEILETLVKPNVWEVEYPHLVIPYHEPTM